VASLVAATHIQIVCPAGSPPLRRAVNYIVALLRNQPVKAWGGFTHSQMVPTAFTGYFWDEDREHSERSFWEQDHNVLILIDAAGETSESLVDELEALNLRVNESFERYGIAQKAVWITTQPLSILLPGEP